MGSIVQSAPQENTRGNTPPDIHTYT